MGRMELVQKIVAENPHIVRRDIEAIVDTIVQEIAPNSSESEAQPTGGPSVVEPLRRFLDTISTASDEELDQSINNLDPSLARELVEAAFNSLAWCDATLREMVRDNARFHEEFQKRAKEIRELNAANDERIRRLIAS
jgi:hypothetical protein